MRTTALPSPGSEEQLRALAGRVFSQQLDRDKPLWEIVARRGARGKRFALLAKTHHALVDGISGVDIVTVLFDTQREPAAPPDPGEKRWLPAPMPRAAAAARRGAARARDGARRARPLRALAFPCTAADSQQRARRAVGVGAMAWAGVKSAPPSPYNDSIGPHRRFTWVRVRLDDVKAIKNSLGGTVNDVVLATVAGGLGRHLRARGVPTEGLELKAMVPVSVRSDAQRGQLGNRVAAMMAPLPVWAGRPDRAAFTS